MLAQAITVTQRHTQRRNLFQFLGQEADALHGYIWCPRGTAPSRTISQRAGGRGNFCPVELRVSSETNVLKRMREDLTVGKFSRKNFHHQMDNGWLIRVFERLVWCRSKIERTELMRVQKACEYAAAVARA